MNNPGAGLIRKNNTRNRILSLIRERGKISKIQLKKETRYSMATVLSTVNRLLDQNLVYYAEKGKTSSGRKPVYISLNAEGGYFIGITFNAADISGAILNFCGESIHYFRQPFPVTGLTVEFVLDSLKINLLKMLDVMKGREDRIIGIGVGSPGYLDENTGISIFYPHIPRWKNIDILGFLTPLVKNIPVYIEHNTNGMALAYKWLRPQYRGMCYLIISIRSGIKMSCVFDNILYKGKNYTAGEIGHIRVSGSKRYCPCGKSGCLESEVSETAIRERILEGVKANRFANLWEKSGRDFKKINIDLFIEQVLAGDPECVFLLDEICGYLGESLTQLLNILNPEKIILSSELNKIGAPLFDRLTAKIRENAIFVALENFTLEPTEFGNTLAAIGAACIAMDHELAYVDAII
ncbi:MAG: ROK family protein [Treponema sp.]|nr:ROK family protein [Treponema sp.]